MSALVAAGFFTGEILSWALPLVVFAAVSVWWYAVIWRRREKR